MRHLKREKREVGDLGARTARVTRDDDPFAFGALARGVFADVDAEALREDSSEDEAARDGRASGTRLGRGVSVFERVRREKEREREREGRVVAAAKAAVAKTVASEATPAKATEEAYEFDAFDEPEDAGVGGGLGDDDENGEGEVSDEGDENDEDEVMIVEEKASENARPAEDLFDEVAAASPNGKRAKREPATLTRAAPKKKNEPIATAPVADEMAREKATTIRREESTSAPAEKKKKVTLEEFAGEDKRGNEYGDDDARGALPQSGAQLADIDEAQYAISGLAAGRDVKEKIRSVGVLVNLLSNQRTRRMLTSYGVHNKIIQAAQGAALSAHAPKTLHFGCAAILFLCGGELRATSSGIMLGSKSASSLRAILRANRASDEAAYAKTNGVIRECLKALKFLPHEAKDPQTLALLVAHQSLKGEQDALLASGSGPGSTNSANSFRNVLASQGAILATCELIASAALTLKAFGAAGFEQVTSCVIRDDDADACDASTEQEAARALARLFRCARVLECASFESRETCEVISSSTLATKSSVPESSDISLVRVTAAQQERVASEDSLPRSAPVDISSPSPIKSRVPGGITLTPPSARRGFPSTRDDDDGDDAMITDMSPLSPPIAAFAGRGIATQWLAENAQMQTPVKGSSPNARTAVRALVDIIPTLGAMTTASVIGSKRNDVLVDRLRVRYNGSIAVDSRVAVGALKSTLCVLTNATNENEDGCAAVVGEDYRGLGHIASLILWLALSIEGFSLRDPRDRKRSRKPTDDSGSTLLCAALVLTINIVESDGEAANFLRVCACDCDFKASPTTGRPGSTPMSFTEALTMLYLQSGGADGDADDSAIAPGESSAVTADMIKSCSEDLILQAYSGLLLAFLIEEQPMLRAEVVSRFPPSKEVGESPLAPLADTLERFHAFHESVNTLSAKSSERLVRVVRWLR